MFSFVNAESKDYEKKMVWLEGLSNIQLGRVVEFLEPIASGSNGESRHLRVLAAWASLPTAPLRPDVVCMNKIYISLKTGYCSSTLPLTLASVHKII